MPTRKNTPFVLTFLGFTLAVCLFGDASEAGMFTCHFYHANLFHWAANALCLWIMRPKPFLMMLAYFPALVAAIVAPPFVGISAMLYACFGLNAPFANVDRKGWLTLAVMNFATLLIPGIAFTAHAVSFFVGVAYTIILIHFNKKQ